MSDLGELENPLRVASEPMPQEPDNALAALKAIRQSRGMSLEDVSARLKFAPRQIEAFENGEWDSLPSGIGLRTLAKNYSRLLGVDMMSIEPLLPKQDVRGGSTIARQHSSGPGLGMTMEQVETHRSWPWMLIIILVVIVVLGIAVWQGIFPRTMLPEWVRGLFE